MNEYLERVVHVSQLALDFAKRARRDDPETSHAAAARLSEFAHDHHAKILGSLLMQGCGTIHEIAARIGLDHVAVARRLPELEEQQVARPTEETRLSPRGRACRVWKACGTDSPKPARLNWETMDRKLSPEERALGKVGQGT